MICAVANVTSSSGWSAPEGIVSRTVSGAVDVRAPIGPTSTGPIMVGISYEGVNASAIDGADRTDSAAATPTRRFACPSAPSISMGWSGDEPQSSCARHHEFRWGARKQLFRDVFSGAVAPGDDAMIAGRTRRHPHRHRRETWAVGGGRVQHRKEIGQGVGGRGRRFHQRASLSDASSQPVEGAHAVREPGRQIAFDAANGGAVLAEAGRLQGDARDAHERGERGGDDQKAGHRPMLYSTSAAASCGRCYVLRPYAPGCDHARGARFPRQLAHRPDRFRSGVTVQGRPERPRDWRRVHGRGPARRRRAAPCSATA